MSFIILGAASVAVLFSLQKHNGMKNIDSQLEYAFVLGWIVSREFPIPFTYSSSALLLTCRCFFVLFSNFILYIDQFRLNTDIMFGNNCGLRTVLVLTGISSLKDVENVQTSVSPDNMNLVPDFYMPSLESLKSSLNI